MFEPPLRVCLSQVVSFPVCTETNWCWTLLANVFFLEQGSSQGLQVVALSFADIPPQLKLKKKKTPTNMLPSAVQNLRQCKDLPHFLDTVAASTIIISMLLTAASDLLQLIFSSFQKLFFQHCNEIPCRDFASCLRRQLSGFSSVPACE